MKTEIFKFTRLLGIDAFGLYTNEHKIRPAIDYLIKEVMKYHGLPWITRIEIEQTEDFIETGEVYITAWVTGIEEKVE